MRILVALLLFLNTIVSPAYGYKESCDEAKKSLAVKSNCSLDDKKSKGENRYFKCKTDSGDYQTSIKYMSKKSPAGYSYRYCEIMSMNHYTKIKIQQFTEFGTVFEAEYPVFAGEVNKHPLYAKWINHKSGKEMSFKLKNPPDNSESNFYLNGPCSKNEYHLFVQGLLSGDCTGREQKANPTTPQKKEN